MELNQPGPTKSISINRSKLLVSLVGICLEGDCSDYILSYQHIVQSKSACTNKSFKINKNFITIGNKTTCKINYQKTTYKIILKDSILFYSPKNLCN